MYFPLSVLLGFGCVAVVAALWYSGLSDPHREHNDDDNNRKKFGKSKPGDKCPICLKQMTAMSMYALICGHALCQTPCYKEYRQWSLKCPLCKMTVIRLNVPGDSCCICLEPMSEENMEYMKCEHALHKKCLQNYRGRNSNTCPICRRPI